MGIFPWFQRVDKSAFLAHNRIIFFIVITERSLVGSPWLPEVSDGILFLEDVDEAAYRVERMLLTLLDAGILERQRAILLGDFAGANNAWRFPGDATLARVFDYIRSRLPERVLMVSGLPFGHVPHQATLPVGR